MSISEILNYEFMRNAVIAGVLIGFLGSLYGAFVVQKKISFMGSGIAHAAFGGVALGIFFGIEPLITTAPFTLLLATIFFYFKQKTKVSFDAIIGIMYAFSFALGAILLSKTDNFVTDAFSYLFGSILAVTQMDLYFLYALTIITLLVSLKLWGKWVYSGFDSELAQASGVRVNLNEMILVFLITLTIVISIKIVGIVLISAYLVIPAGAAALISNTFFKMSLISIAVGVFTSVVGLFLAFMLDMPAGAVIIILQTLVFIIFFLIKNLFKSN